MLRLSNATLGTLAQKYGTPLYAYNADLIVHMYTTVGDFIKWPRLKVFYAMKANTNVHVLDELRACNAYLDTVSEGDVDLGLKRGYPSDHMLYTANNITRQEMRDVKSRGVMMNIGDLSLLEKYGRDFPNTEVVLRFNSEVVAGEFVKVQTTGPLSKFGILMEGVGKANEIVSRYKLTVVGLHCHTGSGIKDIKKYYESMRSIGSLAKVENFPELRSMDFGGGFKVPYSPDEHRIDYATFGKGLTDIYSHICENYGRELELHFEPGKYIVAESGYLLIEVNTVKDNRGKLIVGTNSGFPQLIRPVFYDAYHHIVNVTNPYGPLKTYSVAGNICEGGDFFARDRQIAEIRENDILAIENGGAYCYVMGGEYNTRPMPAEVTLRHGVPIGIRIRKRASEIVDEMIRESHGIKN